MAKPRCRSARNWPSGSTLTSAVGYSLDYNTLDNNKNPTDGLLIDFKQDFAGVGGDVSYLKSRDRREILHPAGRRYRRPDPPPGRHPQPGRQHRSSHARSVPDGPEPCSRLCSERHRSARPQSLRHAGCARRHQILGRVDGTADAVLVPAEGSGLEGRRLCRCRRPVRLSGADDRGLRRAKSTMLANPTVSADAIPQCRRWYLYGIGIRQRQSGPHLGRCRLDLGSRRSVRCASTMRFRSPRVSYDVVQEFKFGGGTTF